jgi:hypothetical protein
MPGLAGLAVLLPVLAAAQTTTYDFDRTATFAAYRTFAFRAGTSSGDSLVDARVLAALDTELTRKGLTRVGDAAVGNPHLKTTAAPDVFVVFHMAYDTEKDISSYSSGPTYGGYGWVWGAGWGSTYTDVRVREILLGTLVVDVIDARRQTVAWRGLGTQEVDRSESPDERDQNIVKAVANIMRNYPPGAEDED